MSFRGFHLLTLRPFCNHYYWKSFELFGLVKYYLFFLPWAKGRTRTVAVINDKHCIIGKVTMERVISKRQHENTNRTVHIGSRTHKRDAGIRH